MKTTNQLLLVMAAVAALSACGPKEPVQTVDWYKAHPAERDAMLGRCQANPGELASSPNCVNATDARNSQVWSSRKGIEAPKPLTFGKKPDSKKPGGKE
jgi:predicted small lipoprotein YifL